MRYLSLAIDIAAMFIFAAFIVSGIGGLIMLFNYPKGDSMVHLIVTSLGMIGFGTMGMILGFKSRFS